MQSEPTEGQYYWYPPFHTFFSPAQQRGRRPACKPGAWKLDGGSHSSEQQKESWNTCCGGSASDHWEAQSPLSVTAAKRNTLIPQQTIRKIGALWQQSHQTELAAAMYTFLIKASDIHFTLYRHSLTWRIPTGNSGVGAVVSQRRKSGCGLVSFSRAFSRDCSQRMRRWTFCSISQWPRVDAVSSSWRATYTFSKK